jgi:hypothetical protein
VEHRHREDNKGGGNARGQPQRTLVERRKCPAKRALDRIDI